MPASLLWRGRVLLRGCSLQPLALSAEGLQGDTGGSPSSSRPLPLQQRGEWTSIHLFFPPTPSLKRSLIFSIITGGSKVPRIPNLQTELQQLLNLAPRTSVLLQIGNWPGWEQELAPDSPGVGQVRGSRVETTPPPQPWTLHPLNCLGGVLSAQGLVAHNVNLKPGGCVRVRGQVAADPKSFIVNLGKDSNNLSLHINPRFKLLGETKRIVYNSRKAGVWETEMRDSVFPFEPGNVTEVCITFDQAELTIKLPDGHTFKFPNRHNVDTINYLETHGDFKLMSLTFE